MFNIQVSSVEAGAAEPSGRWILGGVRPLGAVSLPVLSHVDIEYSILKIGY